MKITINTSPQNVEIANFILGQAIKKLQEKPDLLELSSAQVELAAKFRRSLMKAFLKPVLSEENGQHQ